MEKKFLNQELEVAQAGADVKEGSRGSRIGKIITTTVFSFSILLAIFAISFVIIFFISDVYGSSMMVTLNASFVQDLAPDHPNQTHDSVLVNKFKKPKPGDIIVVKHYWATPRYDRNGSLVKMEYFIKRLIATEGQRVRFERELVGEGVIISDSYTPYRYKLFVDDIEVDEYYLDIDGGWGIMAFYGDNIYEYIYTGGRKHSAGTLIPFKDSIKDHPTLEGVKEIVIGPGEIFYMGDNRGSDNWGRFALHSYDCTSFGPQQASYIEGVRVDTIPHNQSFPGYLWSKFKWFFSFKWI